MVPDRWQVAGGTEFVRLSMDLLDPNLANDLTRRCHGV